MNSLGFLVVFQKFSCGCCDVLRIFDGFFVCLTGIFLKTPPVAKDLLTGFLVGSQAFLLLVCGDCLKEMKR